jgi:aminoglycoside phosphotransferase (APT) family kinase protein
MSGAEDSFAGVKPVEARHRFDEAALDAWMAEHVEGYAGPLEVSQFRGGQSNPTYRLATPDRAYVLRRKPFGPLLPSAHAVDREFRVISALHSAGFPAPCPYVLCADEGVIGAMFYVMSMVEGRVIWDASMPGASPGERRATFEAEIATLAQLHQLDPEAIGLGDYGRPGNYFARQVERWTRQYRAAEIDLLPEMDRLIAWLPGTVPLQERTSIVHGDYRMDNMVFAPDAPRVEAVLDWELSTLGDPLADFSYLAMNWLMPADGRSGLAGLDLEALGVPSLDEAVALYCRLTGRPGLPDLNWYFAFGLFRLASITQGVAKRIQVGTAASAQAQQTAARTPHLAAAAWSFARKAGVSRS